VKHKKYLVGFVVVNMIQVQKKDVGKKIKIVGFTYQWTYVLIAKQN
jgi:hypothetical protein